MTVAPVLERVDDFAALIATDLGRPRLTALRAAETTGRPLGNADFIAGLERMLRRPIARRAPGRKPKAPVTEQMALLTKHGE